ncbi:asparaginase, partial [Rhizobium ruizarguesonis]
MQRVEITDIALCIEILIQQARTLDAPTALHNNCSGKHAGFICACCHQDL